MFQSIHLLSLAIAVGLAVVLSGCGNRSSHDKHTPEKATGNVDQKGPSGQGETANQAAHDGHEGHADVSKSAEHGDQSNVASPDAATGLAELSDADAALAKKQRICPVSGDVLGAMGKPYKVTIQGKTVFLCCPGCEAEIRKNPEKYLSKIED